MASDTPLVERLRAENDELRKCAEAAEARITKMLELVDAARPFAALIDRQDATDVAWLVKQGANPDDLTRYSPDEDKVHSSGEIRGALFLTRGDFRRLSATLRALSQEPSS